jgi:cytochrome c biogenesis protein CcmG/thiol:disulfide interchange protein DsbE
MKRVSASLGVTGLVSALLAVGVTGAPALAIPRPGDPAPPIALVDPTGKPISLTSFAGKPVYLNFFASWCGPCRVETPGIVALAKQYGSRIQVVGVDVGESPSKARGYIKDFKIPYPIGVDQQTATRPSYGGGLYFPLHVFIDRKGVVKLYHPGEMSAAEIAAALDAIAR